MIHARRPVFDNPIEPEKLPGHPLTFELVALPQEDPPRDMIFRALLISFSILIVGSVLGPMLVTELGVSPSLFAFMAGAVALMLVGWATSRPACVVGYGWEWGAGLSFAMLFSTMLAGVIGTRVGWVACAALLVFASGELAFHWFTVRQRSLNPRVPDNPEEPFVPDGFFGALFPAILVAIFLAHVPLIPGGSIVVVVIAAVFWTLKRTPEEDREGAWLNWRRIRYAVTQAYAYPEGPQLPGMLRSHIGPHWFRPFPASLYLSATFVVTVGPDILPAAAAGAVGSDTVIRILLNLLLWAAVGPGLLLIVWSHTAETLVGVPPVGFAPGRWAEQIDAVRESINPLERSACFLGTVAADGSPVLVDRSLLREHVHFLGDTGGGKTSTGLMPLIEQLISFGDSTVISIDLKGDTHEILASAVAANERLARRTGTKLPIKYFSLEAGKATHAFNPLSGAGWQKLTRQQRASVLCAACGLHYGNSYGRAVFSSHNNMVVYSAETLRDEERTFRMLYRDVQKIIQGEEAPDVPQDTRRVGIHPLAVTGRLASISAMNVTQGMPGYEAAIDLEDCFRNPQIVHFHLPSTTAADLAGMVARLAVKFLITAAQGVEKRCQVYVVIDEFQRMAAEDLSLLLQQARSHDVSLVVANQSIEDLGEHGSSLLNVMETSCHVRQWFTVSGRKDLAFIQLLSGSRNQDEVSSTTGGGGNGDRVSYTTRTVQVPRITVDDALYVSNQTDLSILRVTGSRDGYAQYRGLPFIVRTPFHITEEEYQRRKKFKWPEGGDGMIVMSELPPPISPKGTRKKSAGWDTPPLPSSDAADVEISDWDPEGF